MPTNPYVGPQYETLLLQPLGDRALRIPPHRRISIRHSMVLTAMRVEGAETVADGVLSQVQPDLSTGAPWAPADDPT